MAIADLDFADDICLLDDNPEDAQRLLDRVAENAAYVGLETNVDKTKFCSHSVVQKFTVNNQKNRKSIRLYLFGEKIQLNGDISKQVKTRMEKAAGGFNNLKRI